MQWFVAFHIFKKFFFYFSPSSFMQETLNESQLQTEFCILEFKNEHLMVN